jgi:histidyl-tRNA synthetase
MFKVSWFPELLPEEKLVEEKILNIIKTNYQKFGYTPIETPAVERNSVLTAKWWGEVSKQIFWLYGLANGCDDKKDYSLHFDLTVPFARYVIDHKNDLNFPFKRSQIQKVWRWERAQRGRFREFYQADIDVIFQEWEYRFYDAEVIFVILQTLKDIFKQLWLNNSFKIYVNNKKIISWYLSSFVDNSLINLVIWLIDKKDKLPKDRFIQEFEKLGLNSTQINKILEFINYSSLDDLKSDNGLVQEWIKEMKEIFSYFEKLGILDYVKLDFSIMRGLDYYTGIVFETFIEWERSLGSVASGGRYENFTKFIDPKISLSWVGGSIWISRLESFIFDNVKFDKKTTTDYLIVNFEQTQKEALWLYKKLLSEWKSVEFYPKSDKLSKQFKYADKKKIPYVIILGEDELAQWVYQIKNMNTGEKLLQKFEK